ncbi:MAG TPA: rod shape-determining protein RodA, partial [Flavobacteriales bacterium]|nr:rod shape-determining protein RodA [Flavobacteriales bacterium]
MTAVRDSIRANMDRPLTALYLLLLFAGWANIYSAAYNPDHPNLFDTAMEYGNQSVWIVVCLVLGAAVMMVHGDFIKNMAVPAYSVSLLLLALVPVLGKEVGGNTNWLQLGPVRIQPSEFAKFATALVLTRYLSGLQAFRGMRTRAIATAIILAPVGLILLGKDVGTALTFGAFILVLYREGLSGNILLLAIGVAILAVLSLILRESMFHIPFWGREVSGQYFLIGIITLTCLFAFWFISRFVLKGQRKRLYGFILFTLIGSAVFISAFDFVFENVLSERHRTRIGVTLGLVYDPQGLGYNAEQSKTAIGSGGLIG